MALTVQIFNFLINAPDSDIDHAATYIDWRSLCRNNYIVEEVLIKYKQYITNWDYISKYRNLSDECLINCCDYIDWKYIAIPSNRIGRSKLFMIYEIIEGYEHLKYFDFGLIEPDRNELSEDMIRRFQDRVDWGIISAYENLTDEFIREFHYKFNWTALSCANAIPQRLWIEFGHKIDWTQMCRIPLQESIIRMFAHVIDLNALCETQILSDAFMTEFAYVIDQRKICTYQRLSEDYIRKFADVIDWDCACKYQTLSENLMRVFSHLVNWNTISYAQRLSEGFVREFSHLVNWTHISWNQSFSNEFMREHGHLIVWRCVEPFVKYSFVKYIKKEHSKETFLMAEVPSRIPVDIIDNIFSYL